MISWAHVLELLDRPDLPRFLPAAAICPCCSGSLTVYPTAEEGPWWWCQACDRTGDGPDFLACSWNCELTVAIQQIQLHLRLSSNTVSTYAAARKRRIQFETAWRLCRATYSDHNTISVSERQSHTAYPDVGYSTVQELAGSLQQPLRSLYRRRWQRLVVLPYCDAPRHVVGLLVADTEDNLNAGIYLGRLQKEAGWAFLHTAQLALPHQQTGDSLFISPNATWATEVHQHSVATWPLLCSRQSKTHRTTCWQLLPTANRICCDTQQTPALLETAAASQAKAAVLNRRRINSGLLPVIFHTLQRTAVSWQEQLRRYIKPLPPPAAIAFLKTLRLPPEAATQACGTTPELRELSNLSQPVAIWGRRVFYANTQLTAAPAGWQHTKLGTVADCVATITEIVYDSYQDTVTYCGRLYWRGHCVNFMTPEPRRGTDPIGWVQKTLYARQLGPAVIHPRWAPRFWALTLLSSRPKITLVQHGLGWQAETNTFVFPSWVLHKGGRFQPRQVPADLRPASNVPLPGGLCWRLMQQLQQLPPTRLATFWSILTGIVLTAVAPIYRFAPPNIALVSTGAQLIGRQVAKAFGCDTAQISGWLHYHEPATARSRFCLAVEKPDGQMIATSLVRGYCLALNDDWFLITDSNYRRRLPSEILTSAGQLVGNYLQDLAARDFVLNIPTTSHGYYLELQVFRDFAGWVRKNGGPEIGNCADSAEHRRKTRRWLYAKTPQGRLQHLTLLLQQLALTEDALFDTLRGKHDWLNQRVLQQTVLRNGGIPLHAEQITAILTAGQVGGMQVVRHETNGWLVLKTWRKSLQRHT